MMRETSEVLERAAQTPYRSAEALPDAGTADRLNRLGDAVIAEAKDIARRAEKLTLRPADADPAD
jgi:hypothetical protein